METEREDAMKFAHECLNDAANIGGEDFEACLKLARIIADYRLQKMRENQITTVVVREDGY